MTEVAGCVQEVLQLNRRLCVPGQKKEKESAGRPTQAHPLAKESSVAAPAVVQVLLLLHCTLCTGSTAQVVSCKLLYWVHVHEQLNEYNIPEFWALCHMAG